MLEPNFVMVYTSFMRIDGNVIAEQIRTDLVREIVKLKQRGVTPTLSVVQVGGDPGSTAYIKQKQKAAEQIGAKLILYHVSRITYQGELQKFIQKYNEDPSVHGIIVQRPLPEGNKTDPTELLTIHPIKDVDGFLPNSPYPVPVALAVQKMLEEVIHNSSFILHNSIVVLGRGETAGKPIADALLKQGYNVTIVHSQTPNPDDAIRTADIVISCVGKPNVVRRDNVKQKAILVSVGISRDSEGKLHGDYEEEDIKDVASFYTPTPGGVGPVNVACLMANLVRTANKLL